MPISNDVNGCSRGVSREARLVGIKIDYEVSLNQWVQATESTI